jgi:hypothetical protein
MIIGEWRQAVELVLLQYIVVLSLLYTRTQQQMHTLIVLKIQAISRDASETW